MAEKDSDSTDPGLDCNARNFGPEAVKYAAEFFERMIRDLKLKRQRRNKDHDHDHDHPYPSVPQETDLVLTNEEELKFLKSELKDWEEKQKLTPRISKMGEKNDDSNHPGLDNDTHDFGLVYVKSTVDLVEWIIRDAKPRKERTKKDGDHDHPEPSGPQETDIVLILEEQLKFLKSKMKSCEKEHQELDTMEKKVAEGLEQELIAPVSQLEIPTKSVVRRIRDMKNYEDGGSIDYDEIKMMRLAGKEKEEYQKNPDGLLAQLMGDSVFPDDGKGHSEYRKKNTNFRSQELKKIEEENETKLETTMAMRRSLDEFEKDQKELDTMEKKDADGIEQELIAMILQLDSSTKCVSERLYSMKTNEDSGSFDHEKLETIRLALEELQEYKKNPNGLLARMLRIAILPDNGEGNHEYRKRYTEFSSQELKKIKEEIETKLAALVEVQRSLAELEDEIGTDISTDAINKRGIFLSCLLVGFLFMYFLRRKERAFRDGFKQLKLAEFNKFVSVVRVAEEALTSVRNLKTKRRVKDLKTLPYDEGMSLLAHHMAQPKKKTDISDKLKQLKKAVTILNQRLYDLSDGKVNKVMCDLNKKINHIWEN
ncbi:hypothetical protein TIFTF001_012579 [Ficus carica]|uniref:Uncharacterized protein n=1 Tax=Ficus carica TaxID=3494 RepID=A0AA88D6F0_FICCA|nr:hypothetical protein TIFTF001_012579 [Ficus carica]